MSIIGQAPEIKRTGKLSTSNTLALMSSNQTKLKLLFTERDKRKMPGEIFTAHRITVILTSVV